MRRLVALVILFTPLSLLAAEWSPYVDVGGQMGATFLDLGKRYTYDSRRPPFIGFGTLFESGFVMGRHSIYLSYSFPAPEDNHQRGEAWLGQGLYGTTDSAFVHSYYEDARWWTDKRWSLGWRMVLSDDYHQAVRPVVGLALTLGKSYASVDRIEEQRLEYDNQEWPMRQMIYHARSSVKSNLGGGLKAEFGFVAHAVKGLDLILLAQVHSFFAPFPVYQEDEAGVPLGVGDDIVVMPSLQVSARYTFASLRKKH